jgi:superfamily II DNA/RNA helicase
LQEHSTPSADADANGDGAAQTPQSQDAPASSAPSGHQPETSAQDGAADANSDPADGSSAAQLPETFYDFGLHDYVLDGLEAMGFETPTPVQQHAIPIVLKGRDLIACAQTGTGKTAAYLLPALDAIAYDGGGFVHTLIIAPTRELALQIDEQVQGFAFYAGVRSIAVYGGGDASSFETQKRGLTQGADLVIATPGRLISHLNLGYVKFDQVRQLILDEADRMLDMGFYEDIMKIVQYLPKERQNLLFSATMPPRIRELAKRTMHDPEQVNIAISKPAEKIQQGAYLIHDKDKLDLLLHILKAKEDLPSVIVFASTKIAVKNLEQRLRRKGINARYMSSDLEQDQRQEVMNGFANRKVRVLVATDVVSRGIDIDNISMVVNYDVPNDPEDYVHRIGRTARADADGIGITFINDTDQGRYARIEALIEREIEKLPLPEGIPEGPEYRPRKRGDRGGSRGGGGGRGGQRGRQGGGGRGGSRSGSRSRQGGRQGGGQGGGRRGGGGGNRDANRSTDQRSGQGSGSSSRQGSGKNKRSRRRGGGGGASGGGGRSGAQ